MIKKLYAWTLSLAAHPRALWALAILSFLESSVFPIPPDILMVAMILSQPKRAFLIAGITLIASVMGGIFGYFIGSVFLDLAMNVIEFYGYEEKVTNLKNNLSSGNNFIFFLGTLFLAGFTPLPFKVFTITSGIIGFNIFIFFIVCLVSRGLRFFTVSYLSFKFGDTFNNFMEKDAAKWFSIAGLIIATIAITIYFTIK